MKHSLWLEGNGFGSPLGWTATSPERGRGPAVFAEVITRAPVQVLVEHRQRIQRLEVFSLESTVDGVCGSDAGAQGSGDAVTSKWVTGHRRVTDGNPVVPMVRQK